MHTTGKKAVMKAIRMEVVIPVPIQTTIKGATATLGMTCEAITIGRMAAPIVGHRTIITARSTPKTALRIKPTRVLLSVINACAARSPLFSHSDASTADGAGNRNSGTSSILTRISQTITARSKAETGAIHGYRVRSTLLRFGLDVLPVFLVE